VKAPGELSISLVELVLELRPLLADVERNRGRIASVLDAHRALAEYEVARALVRRALPAGMVASLCESPDPRERKVGIDLVRLTYRAGEGARLLRPRVKDVEMRVRGRARQAVRSLGLDEVALPDARRTPERWDPSGWSFGSIRRPTRVANLARWGLPTLASGDDVRALLGLDEGELPRLMRAGAGPGSPWVSFEIEKRGGGARTITAPRARLRAAQRTLLRELLDKVPAHDAAHGFVKGRSVVTNAAPHASARVVLKLDLQDFFPTIHFRRVAGIFRHLGYSDDVSSTLAGLTTWRPKLDDGRVLWPGQLPQGAPTSPALANLACRRLDARLAGLAARARATYTRYADDLTFSFADAPDMPLGRLAWWVDQICAQEGFEENLKKRRVLRQQSRQLITGVVVNEGPRVPRASRRRFRATLHNCRVNGVAAEARGREDFPAYLRGFAAWVRMVQPELGARWLREVEELLEGAA
jgi:hypothetical protein